MHFIRSFFRFYRAICLVFFWNMLIWILTTQFCGKLGIYFSDIGNLSQECITLQILIFPKYFLKFSGINFEIFRYTSQNFPKKIFDIFQNITWNFFGKYFSKFCEILLENFWSISRNLLKLFEMIIKIFRYTSKNF